MFNGELSSWWTRIAIGLLTLIFIGVQSAFAASGQKRRQITVAARKKGKGEAEETEEASQGQAALA